MTPKITIGLPVYNGEKFIKKCIESILNQTFLDFELLISDNASTDSTSEICNEYASKDKRIRYSCNLKNIGGIENFKFQSKKKHAFKTEVYGGIMENSCKALIDNFFKKLR